MSASDSDLEVLRSAGGIPTSPFEIQVTRDALQRRLDAGDITREDIEMLKRSYRWMTISSALGWATGIPVWFALRRRPAVSGITRLSAALSMSMVGSFLGFTAGGAAAALEVNRNMPDAKRKLEVFQQIVVESKRAIAAHHAGLPTEDRDTTAVADGPKSVPFSGQDQEQTLAAAPATPALPPSTPQARGGPVAAEVERASASTWERLRTTRAPPAPAASAADELKRQQAEFDAMLEKERRGGDSLDKWN